MGSFSTIAMNGMAASDKIFHLLDLEEPQEKTKTVPNHNCGYCMQSVGFRYNEEREILKRYQCTVSFKAVLQPL
ncbi:MAG: hypothetical protein ACLTE2_13065 [Eubacteriales bacterium]